MNAPPLLWTAFGKPTQPETLRIEKAQRLVTLLQESGSDIHASLREVRSIKEKGCEVVVFTVEVERPQRVKHDIKKQEWIQVGFFEDDSKQPEVYSLRVGFPQVPHLSLTGPGQPQLLCLYEQPWDEVRLNWTAAQFIGRIRYWLAKTACGTLHGDDQPLEPLIAPSGSRLLLPSDFSLTKKGSEQGLLDIFCLKEKDSQVVLAAYWKGQRPKSKKHSIAAVFECVPQRHGIMRHQPNNLHELHELCVDGELDLAGQLLAKIQSWHREKPDPNILRAGLVLIIQLPKTRQSDVTESVETRAFVTSKSVEEVGQHLGAIAKDGGAAGYIIGEIKIDPEELKKVPVGLLQVHHSLDAAQAAILNGVELYNEQVVAIGVGSLGSQVFNNLLRAGFGKWCLIDNDILLPHNCARHFLGDWAVGYGKAESMSNVANGIFDVPDVSKSLEVDVLRPGSNADVTAHELNNATVIMDFSASVAVTRHLASEERKARHLTAFMSPKGESLILGIEDKERMIRLDWLEMLHYRSVLNNSSIAESFVSSDTHIRYGNACRDTSARIAQDDVAMWAAIASKNVKTMLQTEAAQLRIYTTSEDGGVTLIREPVSKLGSVVVGQWRMRFDDALLKKLAAFRATRLPNETGGVLVGHFDTCYRICSIVDMIPSPPDSVEWPVSYIRGCQGLKEQIEDVERRTLNQLTYVGEWHSHPDGSSTMPSRDDLEAYSWLISHMRSEDLPAVMLIVGQGGGYRFVAISS